MPLRQLLTLLARGHAAKDLEILVLRQRAAGILARDCFTVDTAWLRRL